MRRDFTEYIEDVIIGSGAVRGLARGIARLLDGLFSKTVLRPLKLLANGTWFGHPLHPLLTDIPVGTWTAAILFDLIALVFNVPALGLASGILIGLGVLGALGAIATGAMDWMDVDPPELSLGIVHAIINSTATLLFAISFFWRWSAGWAITVDKFILSLVAYGIVGFGAFLGGTLVFRLGTMINQNAHRGDPHGKPGSWVPALAVADLPENQLKRVDVKGSPVLLVRRGDKVYAIGAVCSHYGAPLEEGALVGDTVQCPWHYSRFALSDGSIKEGPATSPMPAYDAMIKDGQVQISLRK